MSVTFGASDHRRPHPRVEGAYASVELDGEMNLCNTNARALLAMLKIPNEDLIGECSLLGLQRAIAYCSVHFEQLAPAFTRPDDAIYGPPRVNLDGTIEMRPLRMRSQGIDASYLRDKLDCLAILVLNAAERGATHITWG